MNIFNKNSNSTFSIKEASGEIKRMYKGLHFSDMYGNALVQFIVLTLLLIGVHYYFKSLVNAQPIRDNWPNERCKPQNIMLAGFINKPKDKSIAEYTQENFTFCVQSVLKNIVGYSVNPMVFVTEGLQELFLTIGVALNEIRFVFAYIRNEITSIVRQIFARILNILIPIQQMVIGVRDLANRTQAIMVASLYTFVGVYYALLSGLGSVVDFFVIIIAILLAIAAPLMAVPFTMGIGAAFLGAAAAISIPLILINKTMSKIPNLCFDGETLVELFDQSEKPFSKIQLGEKLKRGETVTAVLRLDAKDVPMFQLDGIKVSGVHNVKYKNKWIPVSQHPESKTITNYNKPFIYCLNTTNKKITIKQQVFSDWDELYQEETRDKLYEVIKKRIPSTEKDSETIHRFLDGGLEGTTLLTLEKGGKREIQHLEIGDILEEKCRITGIIMIDGSTVEEQFEYLLGDTEKGETICIRGGPNLVYSLDNKTICSTLFLTNKECKNIVKREKLYHLLTDSGYFKIGSFVFYDYNKNIEFF